MKLIPISEHPDHAKILWDLLAERPATANISHKEMPTWEDHLRFVEGKTPKTDMRSVGELAYNYSYEAWYLIEFGEAIVGDVYLTRHSEIGLNLFPQYRREGLGPLVVKALVEKHGPRRYLANIAPDNQGSRRMFERMGFKVIQHTLALEAE